MHRRSFIRTVGVTSLMLAVPGCASSSARGPESPRGGWRATLLRDHPLVGKIWDAESERYVSAAVLMESLTRAHFRLLGEVHDNADAHAIQAELLEEIAAAGPKPLVAMEQMDRKGEATLQQRLASTKLTADEVAKAAGFDEKGWNWPFYRPLVDIALRAGMPLRAANLSRKEAGQVARKGLDALGESRVAALRLEAAWSAEREQALREIIREGHCGALPESALPNMAAAQRARDATLAESLLGAGRDGAVLIAGNGHVRRDLAVPLYLAARAADKRSCSVGILEVESGTETPRDYARSAASRIPLYDFVWFTPRWERPDPCAAFRRG
jgi:uncharacterized iron-regulated protein